MRFLTHRRRCPFCDERIRERAHLCPHCLRGIDATCRTVENNVGVEIAGDEVSISGAMSSTSGEPRHEITASMLRVDPVSLEIGADIEAVADPDGPGQRAFLERLKRVRERIAMEFGVIVPGIRVRPHPKLPPGDYQIRIRGDLVAEGSVRVDQWQVLSDISEYLDLDAEWAHDPIYRSPALWIDDVNAQMVLAKGGIAHDAQDVVSTHVAEIIKQHLGELLTREEVAELLNMARQETPTVVQELVPNLLTLGQIRLVLQNLVREKVPIKDLGTILDALADNSYNTKDPFQLTEFVRQALGRKICQRYQSPDGKVLAFVLAPDVERAIQNSIQLNDSGQFLALDPDSSNSVHASLAAAIQEHRGSFNYAVIVCPPRIRRFVKRLFERSFPELVVLSYAEIVVGVQVENIDTINAHVPRPRDAEKSTSSIATTSIVMAAAADSSLSPERSLIPQSAARTPEDLDSIEDMKW